MTDTTRTWAAIVSPFIAKGANAAEKGGAAVAVLGGFTATELAAFGGLIVAVLGYLTNALMTWHFKSQHLKIAQQAAKADPDE
jgi:hypothetical protein